MDSKLQIISGSFKGRKLRIPASARPTQNRARIALFNMLQSLDIMPRVVWDAFAGSGAFGLEILSRYPDARVAFTDIDAATVKIIRDNLRTLNADTRAVAVQTDALGALDKYGADAELIFVDPPYAMADVARGFITQLGGVARPGALVVWEQDSRISVAPDADAWEVLRDKEYGRARFLIFRRKGE